MVSTLPIKLTLFVVISSVVLYYANLPVPDDFQNSPDRWPMRIMAAGNDFLSLLETLGLTRMASFWAHFTMSLRGSWGSTRVRFADTTFDGVKVRVYQPANLKRMPDAIAGMVFIPGGSMKYGNPDSYHGVTVHLASKLNAMIISIDYRKANNSPFPAALDDCVKATVWFLKNADTLKVNPNRIAIVGEGSGGNLAAAVVQRLTFDSRYIDLAAVKFQGLFYPMLQGFDFNMPSYVQNGHDATLVFTQRMLAKSWSLYLVGNDSLVETFVINNHTSTSAKTDSLPSTLLSHELLPSKDRSIRDITSRNYGDENIYNNIKETLLNPDFCPMLIPKTAGLPETYITIGAYDVVRDENILFAERLKEGGVTVIQKWYSLGLHGMLPYFMSPFVLTDGKKCMDDFIDYAKDNL